MVPRLKGLNVSVNGLISPVVTPVVPFKLAFTVLLDILPLSIVIQMMMKRSNPHKKIDSMKLHPTIFENAYDKPVLNKIVAITNNHFT